MGGVAVPPRHAGFAWRSRGFNPTAPRYGVRLYPMSTRFDAPPISGAWRPAILAAIIVSALVSALLPAAAQNPPNRKFLEAPSNLPHVPGGMSLDRLFDALKVAPDNESAKYVENRIWAMWVATYSDTTTLMMGRVKQAIDAKDLDLGI